MGHRCGWPSWASRSSSRCAAPWSTSWSRWPPTRRAAGARWACPPPRTPRSPATPRLRTAPDPAGDHPLHRGALRRAGRRFAARCGGGPGAGPAGRRVRAVRAAPRGRPGAGLPALGRLRAARPAHPGRPLETAARTGAGRDRRRRAGGRPALRAPTPRWAGCPARYGWTCWPSIPTAGAPWCRTSTRRTRAGWPAPWPAPAPSPPTPPGWPRWPAGPGSGSSAAAPRLTVVIPA